MFKIKVTRQFKRKYIKLPMEIKILAEKQEKILIQNPFDERLKTHKLKGKFSKFWSFSVNYQYRIIFTFEGNKIIYYHSVGNHSVYKDLI